MSANACLSQAQVFKTVECKFLELEKRLSCQIFDNNNGALGCW